MRRALPCLLLLLSVTPACWAAQWVVNDGDVIQKAVDKASPGDTILVMPGTYHETVFIDKDGIRLSGVVRKGAWPVLDGRGELHDGVLAAGHGVTIENLYVRHYKGNGIMTQGGNNFRILNNRVQGRSFYGIFPQFGKNGLVAGNIVWDVEDAAIYAGMCENVDIVGNETHGNVIGIETENSHHMLVESNFVHDNSSGIIMTLIPGLPVKSADDTVIRHNFIVHNNTANFAPPGAITADVPPGVGIFIYAADGTRIEGNIIRDNQSVGIMVADQSFIPGPPDPKEDPRPDNHHVLANVFLDNGQQPQGAVGSMLAAINQSTGPDILTTGKGRNNCLSDPAAVRTVGTEGWQTCDPGESTRELHSAQLSAAVPSPTLSAEQKGRLTYLAVCTGCHSYSTRLLGPPLVTSPALYKGRPDELARWIASPTKKRPDYAAMPPQNYLPADIRLEVARYILDGLHE